MYCYRLTIETESIDYYTDEHTYYPATVYQFSDDNIWLARLRLVLFLIQQQRYTTIVHFHKISVQLSYSNQEEFVSLGSWHLRDVSKGKNSYAWSWDNESEAIFLEKYALYRPADKELLNIEQELHQVVSKEEKSAVNTRLTKELKLFEEKYASSLNNYTPELGILYFFLDDYVKAFQYFIVCPMPCLQNITYHTAFYLAHFAQKADFEYMRIYDTLYNERPFLN